MKLSKSAFRMGIDIPGFGFDWATPGAAAIEDSGGIDWGDIFGKAFDVGSQIFLREQQKDIAEEQRERAEAEAAAAQARAQEEAARRSGVAADTVTDQSGGQILGVDRDTLLLGGVGLVALLLILR